MLQRYLWTLVLLILAGCSPYPLGSAIDPPFDAQLLLSRVQARPGETVSLRVRIIPLRPVDQIPIYSSIAWANSDECPSEVINTYCVIGGTTILGHEPVERDVPLQVRPDARPGTYRLALLYWNEGTRKRLPFTLEVRP